MQIIVISKNNVRQTVRCIFFNWNDIPICCHVCIGRSGWRVPAVTSLRQCKSGMIGKTQISTRNACSPHVMRMTIPYLNLPRSSYFFEDSYSREAIDPEFLMLDACSKEVGTWLRALESGTRIGRGTGRRERRCEACRVPAEVAPNSTQTHRRLLSFRISAEASHHHQQSNCFNVTEHKKSGSRMTVTFSVTSIVLIGVSVPVFALLTRQEDGELDSRLPKIALRPTVAARICCCAHHTITCHENTASSRLLE